VIQVIQQKGGPVPIDAPAPIVRPGYVLIENLYSVISAGTERMVIESARTSLVTRARQRPDQVRQILRKVATEGLRSTIAQVREKLAEPIPLGYSSAGVVIACGSGVQGVRPGDRVSSNGPHASVVCVARNLCATVPQAVSMDEAAFTTLAAIALQGIRLAKLGLGDSVLVIGLGLLGQLTVRLLRAHGCRVIGTDLDPERCRLAEAAGAERAAPGLTGADISHLTRGIGADAILITAATSSDAPVQLAAEAVRSKGRVVVVGAVGLELPRQPFYLKEAEFVISCSYGPGRYDPEYEDRGHDYPVGYARWTEQRNMQAVLDLLATRQLDFRPLISHRFAVRDASSAYASIETDKDRTLGVVLEYEPAQRPAAVPAISTRSERVKDPRGIGVGFIGSGGFSKMMLLPILRELPSVRLRTLCSASGLAASVIGDRFGFERITAAEDEVFADADCEAIFIATRHDQHARQVQKALAAGKKVFVEKPLALTLAEIAVLDRQMASIERPILMVGFNRRFSPAAVAAKRAFADVREPLTVSLRFNVQPVPAGHWTQQDSIGGGRIIGEACHAVDLATYLVGSPPIRVYAESISGPDAPPMTDDQAFLTLRHANGAISSIAYLAGGDIGIPKERVEIAGGERFAVIDDFRDLSISRHGKVTKERSLQQDKGHKAELKAFVSAVESGAASPIPWDELRAVSIAVILAMESMREGIALPIPDAPTLESWLREAIESAAPVEQH
jgi:predicted dehydrogenase/threonine dehydrogenase-like Zn-dependent dehydrogenase